MSTMIDLINKGLSDAINKGGIGFKAILGDKFFTPAGSITQSSDYNCGAAANELEWAREQMVRLIDSIDPNNASTDLLDLVINALINLPRESSVQTDEYFLNNFNLIVRQDTNPTRCTRSAIHDAIIEYGLDDNDFHLVERFPVLSKYFEIRLVGSPTTGTMVLFLDNLTVGYIDNDYVGGLGLGSLALSLLRLVQRIKAGGVQFAMVYILEYNTTKTSDAKVVA